MIAVRTSAARRAPGPLATHWRYRTDGVPAFDPIVFDERALAARGALAGRATAGRGNTHFLTLDGHDLVLRHYRRGGLVRHVSERRYVWTGLERTRAVREFELLRALEDEGLPAPRAFACAVTRQTLFWSGSLITRRLPGRTLAELLHGKAGAAARAATGVEAGTATGTGGGAGTDVGADPGPRADADTGTSTGAGMAAVPWAAIGRCIARFHAAGVRHADLNAHNVMLDGDDVYLIDFDRARRGRAGTASARWTRRNVERLRRSLAKLATRSGRSFDEDGFSVLERAWKDAFV